ncbi:MAG: PAS domain S-box protein [Spongiibacteraceae bacterium]
MADKQQDTERTLRESEETFRLLVSCVQDYSIYTLDCDGNIASWNAGAERIKGYSADEIVGCHFSIFYTPEDIASGLPQAQLTMAAAAGRCEQEGWRVRKGGSQFLAHQVLTSLRNDNGDLRGFAKVTRDISTRKRLEERFERVVEAAPSAMVMINGTGTIEMVNAQAERVFGYPRAEMLGQPVEMLVPESARHAHPKLRAHFFSQPVSRPMGAGRDLYGRRKNGSEFPVEIGLNPIETDEGIMVLSAIVDISDRKQKAARIEAALQEKDILLGEIHHRVKNNLQIVYSLLDLQAARIDDPTLLGMLQDSQNRIRSMSLIHQTLYESKDFSRVDFASVLDALVPALMNSYSLNPENIAISIDAHEVLLPLNQAIPCGLIINELIANALKHAFPDQRSGKIHIALNLETQNSVVLTVSDDGIGMPPLDIKNTHTLGLKLVSLLTDQLSGEMATNYVNPTQFQLRFPMDMINEMAH